MILAQISLIAVASLGTGGIGQAPAYIGEDPPRLILAAQHFVPEGLYRQDDAVAKDPVPESMYREGDPIVLTPVKKKKEKKVEIDSSAVESRFKSLYAKQGKPRLAFFWNREFTDLLTQWFGIERVAITDSTEFNITGKRKTTVSVESTTGIEKQYRRTDVRKKGPRGAEAWKFESGFLKPFLSSGAKIIDRAAIMRLKAAAMGSKRTQDIQYIETTALLGYADLLVEILFEETGDGPVFKMTVKTVNSGQLLTQLATLGRKDKDPKAPEVAYVPTASGFQPVMKTAKIKKKKPKELGMELMEAMIAAWSG